jgi:nucleoside-diphosphate-sugar epimerase
MPVIVIGADTRLGRAIVERLLEPDREIRVFVSDPEAAEQLRGMGAKTAFGDVSDFSHVGAACAGVFTAVLVGEAARDGRERSFAEDERAVLEGWAGAVEEAAASRVIWVGVPDPPPTRNTEAAAVGDDLELSEVAERVASLDEMDQLR